MWSVLYQYGTTSPTFARTGSLSGYGPRMGYFGAAAVAALTELMHQHAVRHPSARYR